MKFHFGNRVFIPNPPTSHRKPNDIIVKPNEISMPVFLRNANYTMPHQSIISMPVLSRNEHDKMPYQQHDKHARLANKVT